MKKRIIGTMAACLLFSTAQAQQPAARRMRQETRREQTGERCRRADREDGRSRGVQESESAAACRYDGAHLELSYAAYDFGDVKRKGGDLVHDFRIVNDGSAPLVLTRVVTSCSCLKAAFPKRPVPPGSAAVIRITYEPQKNEPGTFHKVIQVYSNSVSGRSIITVRGNSLDPDKM